MILGAAAGNTSLAPPPQQFMPDEERWIVARSKFLRVRTTFTSTAPLFLCWVAAVYAGSTINLGFDSSHYYAPLVLLNVVLDAVALSWAGRWLIDRICRAPPVRAYISADAG